MMLCSNLYVKGLLSQMLITRSEIAFKHMYAVYVCVLQYLVCLPFFLFLFCFVLF